MIGLLQLSIYAVTKNEAIILGFLSKYLWRQQRYDIKEKNYRCYNQRIIENL